MVRKGDRYDASDLEEAQFEPGSRGRVLKNLLGINSQREMDRVEQREQLRALDELLGIYGPDRQFTADDICKIHQLWLAPIYAWAGQYRQVNLAKQDFPFAAARQVPRLMTECEQGPLRRFTPCRPGSQDDVARALAVVHVELILIHPFRDGNGRVARLLANLMAAQAGLPLLDFGGLTGRNRKRYFVAVQAGLDRNYTPMAELFSGVIDRTRRTFSGQRGLRRS
jgi:cell filamentation protein